MNICMITTFFGSHSFGGDAAFVDRLSRALARRGHDVHVIYCRDAFQISKGDQTPRPYHAPEGVTIHPLESRFGMLSPLATHTTGLPLFKKKAISRLLAEIKPDVVHFHNLSLIGGPGLLEMPIPGAIKLMTVHEHWLVCPLHVLWKFDREVCTQRECLSCTLKAHRPPQLWRNTDMMNNGLERLHALICPSLSTRDEHVKRGINVPFTHIPYFLPHDYTGLPRVAAPATARPYFAAVGRLEKIKGFQDAIDAFRSITDVDLRIAGTGRFESVLRDQAKDLPNVHFEGRLDSAQVAALVRGARALIVPSLVHETFGYVVLEAFHEQTPVIVRNLGALPELIDQSRGGLVFDSQVELIAAIARLRDDDGLRETLGNAGQYARQTIWSESRHSGLYLGLIDELRGEGKFGSDDSATTIRSSKQRQTQAKTAALAAPTSTHNQLETALQGPRSA